jgi:hypothetical protein
MRMCSSNNRIFVVAPEVDGCAGCAGANSDNLCGLLGHCHISRGYSNIWVEFDAGQTLREQIALELLDADCDIEAIDVVLGPVLHTVKRNLWDIPIPTFPRRSAPDPDRPIIPWPGVDGIKPSGTQ